MFESVQLLNINILTSILFSDSQVWRYTRHGFFYFWNLVHLIISFCLGAAIGAGVVFWGYVELGNWLVNRLGRIEYYTNKVVGGIFLGLGLLQLI